MAEKEWLAIPEALLRTALAHASPAEERPNATCDVNRSLITALVEWFNEADLGCDHPVNICCCGAMAIHHELKLLLDGKRTCPQCSGDGFTWDQEVHDREVARMSAEGYDDDAADYGYVPCPKCASNGVVAVDEMEYQQTRSGTVPGEKGER